MNGVKLQHQMDTRGSRSLAFRIHSGPWGYMFLGVLGMLAGVTVASGDGSDELGVLIAIVASVPFAIGVIAQGVRVGLRNDT